MLINKPCPLYASLRLSRKSAGTIANNLYIKKQNNWVFATDQAQNHSQSQNPITVCAKKVKVGEKKSQAGKGRGKRRMVRKDSPISLLKRNPVKALGKKGEGQIQEQAQEEKGSQCALHWSFR